MESACKTEFMNTLISSYNWCAEYNLYARVVRPPKIIELDETERIFYIQTFPNGTLRV